MVRATSEPQHVFVGDVQGCADEFEELLGRLEVEFGSEFVLHSVGDLVNRGPDNLRVLERMRELEDAGRGCHVLGNHDVALIAALLGVRPLGERDTLGDVLASSDADDWLEWLRGRPLAEKGEVGGEVFVMVHASVHPDWVAEDCIEAAARVEVRLRAGDRDSVCRFLEEEVKETVSGSDRDVLGRVISCRVVRGESWASRAQAGSDAEPWHRAWQGRGHDYGVVYGHWATQGLHLAPGLRGLDTGCVHHGRGRDGYLTAWLPTAPGDPPGVPPFRVEEPTLWRIPARRRYYPY